jgi:hypothetical protein
LKNSFFATISHGYYIYKTESLYNIATKQKRIVVKVLPTLLWLTGFETQPQNKERPVRGQTLQKGEVHESRGSGDRGGVREQGVRRDLVCLKALDPRTGV